MVTGRAAAVAGIFAPPRPENNPCIAEFCRLLYPRCQYIGDWSREEFAISRAEVELCITPGPETSLDEDKLLLLTESSNSWTEAEHYGKDRSYRIIYIRFIVYQKIRMT